MECKFCNKVCKSKMSTSCHERLCKNNPDRQISSLVAFNRAKNEITHICKYCGSEIAGNSIGAHYVSCIKGPHRIKWLETVSMGSSGRTMTDSCKSSISSSMKVAHKERRAWNIGQSRWNNEQSYPEKFFEKVILNEFIDKEYKTEFPIGIYSIDFAWPKKKLAIEIDGDQHQRFEEYKIRDKRKDEYLRSLGWQVLRIAWKDMFSNTKEKISEAYSFVHTDE